ncbi:MAG: acylphosphatase [Methanosarcinales archaeon]|nr:MAG: acylphosphatase [Methanosarcinales archaeon]
MKQAEITAKGTVQRVGYRDAVERIAQQLDITGFVENLKPYYVKIVAEGEEDILNKFISQIHIKKFPVSVNNLDIKFKAATGRFEYFEIKRGDWREELGERMDVAGILLYRSVELGERSVSLGERSLKLGERSVGLGEKMLEKQDTHAHILTDLRDQTQQNFAILDTKYGRIADTMEKLIDEMRNERKDSILMIENLTEAIIRLAESKK